MTEFKGSIGRTWRESKPWWPQPDRAPADAPDIAYIILDDVGYGWFSCYGGPIDTPNIDRLAANGLLYNNWHTVMHHIMFQRNGLKSTRESLTKDGTK